jgi:hypothetical protein
MSILRKYNSATSTWDPVVIGAQGNSGTIAVTSPITNSGTTNNAVLGIDSTAFIPNVAGKNLVINGAFDYWQRGTSTSLTTTGAYSADRWVVGHDNGSVTFSQQVFAPGTDPSNTGLINYAQLAVTSYTSGASYLASRLEDLRLFAGKTLTLSYWAKASTTVTNYALYVMAFGSGGSTTVVNNLASNTVTTTWQKFSQTFTVPSIVGNTVGTNSYFEIQISRMTQAATIQFAGVQLEYGSIATPFSRAGGTLAGEWTACQRYFRRLGNRQGQTRISVGWASSTTAALWIVTHPVEMRAAPSGSVGGSFTWYNAVTGGAFTGSSVGSTSTQTAELLGTGATGLTTGYAYGLTFDQQTAYVDFNAEL